MKDTAVISMKATADKTKGKSLIAPDGRQELVPAIAIYGANAAGKSNVLHALLLMREMVCGMYAKPLKGDELPQEPFAFVDGKVQPTTFEIIYYYDGIKYAYGYSFDKKRVISEYLYYWPNGMEGLVFSRENGKYEFRENIQEQSTLAGRTADNRLYLTSSNEWNCAQTEKAYLWFQRKIRGLMDKVETNEITIEAICGGGQEKQRVLGEMLAADLGICGVVTAGTKDKPVICMIHQLEDERGNKKQYSLLLGQESKGTQRFFSRIGSWMGAMEDGAVLVVDEIEASMHPLLTRHLIEMVQDPLVNTNHAQLIFTTHDTGLMDLTLLRRDQIWFAERNEKNMQTKLYSLSEFSQSKGENVSKEYLQGRYGAIPFVGNTTA
jgi:AAA15 family ATPase/GTPase